MTKILDRPWLRLFAVLALAAAGILAFFAQGAALDGYYAACPPDHRFITGDFLTGGPPSRTAMLIAKWAVIALPPALLVRRPATVKAIFVIDVVILAAALLHFAVAHTSPYECVTMGGDYEDHASGTLEFVLVYFLMMPLSYSVAIVDLPLFLYQKIRAQ